MVLTAHLDVSLLSTLEFYVFVGINSLVIGLNFSVSVVIVRSIS